MNCEEKQITSGLLTVREAAQYFSVSSRIILKWVASGQLKSFRIAGVLRFTPQAIEAFVAANEAERMSR
jgi:excisionase family DNA binding protein